MSAKYNMREFVMELRETNKWDDLWDQYEMDICVEFLSSTDPVTPHNRLIAARQLRHFMESISE